MLLRNNVLLTLTIGKAFSCQIRYTLSGHTLDAVCASRARALLDYRLFLSHTRNPTTGYEPRTTHEFLQRSSTTAASPSIDYLQCLPHTRRPTTGYGPRTEHDFMIEVINCYHLPHVHMKPKRLRASVYGRRKMPEMGSRQKFSLRDTALSQLFMPKPILSDIHSLLLFIDVHVLNVTQHGVPTRKTGRTPRVAVKRWHCCKCGSGAAAPSSGRRPSSSYGEPEVPLCARHIRVHVCFFTHRLAPVWDNFCNN